MFSNQVTEKNYEEDKKYDLINSYLYEMRISLDMNAGTIRELMNKLI
jgi:hypothetical protein